MQFVILIVLAVAWTVYGIMVWRSRSERRNVNSIATFSQHLSVLERATPHAGGATATSLVGWDPAATAVRTEAPTAHLAPVISSSPSATGRRGVASAVAGAGEGTAPRGAGGPTLTVSQAHRRRRDLLAGLGASALLSLLAAGLLGGVYLWPALLFGGLFVAYVVALGRAQRLASERATKVHYLPQMAPPAEVGYLLDAESTYLRSAN